MKSGCNRGQETLNQFKIDFTCMDKQKNEKMLWRNALRWTAAMVIPKAGLDYYYIIWKTGRHAWV